MTQKIIGDIAFEVTEEGYMIDSSIWTEKIAKELAIEEGIELTEKHYKVLAFIRDKANNGETLTIRAVGKSGIVDIKELYQLFPGGPLKKASLIAGVLKPSSCV